MKKTKRIGNKSISILFSLAIILFPIIGKAQIYVNSTGKVGVAISTPLLPFHVNGTSGVPATSGTTPNGTAMFASNNGNNLYFGSYTASPYGLWLQGASPSALGTNYPIILNPNGGNVGIGITAPIVKLHVSNGDILINNGSYFYRAFLSDGTTAKALLGISSGDYTELHSAANGIKFMSASNIAKAIMDNSGNWGLGITSPASKLHVASGDILISNGYYYRAFLSDGTTAKAVLGVSSGNYTELHSSGNGIKFMNVSNVEKMRMDNNGYVGIGTTSPTRLLEVNGQFKTTNDSPEKPFAGSWTGYSDKRLKKDIAAFNDGLEILRKVNPVTYKSNGIGNLSSTETHIGVIAQDLQPVAPYCVFTGTGRLKVKQSESVNFSGNEIIETLPADSSGEVNTIISPLTYNYDGLIYVMINSIKQLDSTNTAFAKKDSIKDRKIQDMQNQINQLSAVVSSCCSFNTKKSLQENPPLQSLITSKDVELNNKNIVVLDQNVPNPFAEQTTISYFLPDNITRAQIIFLDQSGKLIKVVDLSEKGRGLLNVFANDLTNGIYTYSLIIDGQTVETKKMVKTE